MADEVPAAAGAGGQEPAPDYRHPAIIALDHLVNEEVPEEEVDQQELEAMMMQLLDILTMTPSEANAMVVGRFLPSVLDHLASHGRWMDIVEYLKKCVNYHSSDSVVPAPHGANAEMLANVHAELLCSPHRQQVFVLSDQDMDSARAHFDHYLAPLIRCVPGYRIRLQNIFANIVGIVDQMQLPTIPGNVAMAGWDAVMEIKDYMFLYFPRLRPRLERVRGREQSDVWSFGEKVERADGVKGFRCFSCHRVYWNASVFKLRVHLQGGDAHQPGCPSVLQCTLQRLDLI